MDYTEQISYLTEALLAEMPEYRDEAGRVPPDLEQRRYLLRCLMNVREPRPLAEHFSDVQDALLSAEREARGGVHIS